MNRTEFQNCILSLAGHLNLRWSDRGNCHLGIQRGVFVELREWNGEANCIFYSPTVEIGNQVLENFNGFHHSIAAGIPGTWIGGVMEHGLAGQQTTSHHGCQVQLDGQRVESLGIDGFMAFPDAVVDDLHERGATEAVTCELCGEQTANILSRVNSAFQPCCQHCWDDLQFAAPAGKLKVEHTVNWSRTAPVLLLLTAAGGFLWGLIQQPAQLDSRALLLPIFWAYFLCWACLRVSGGVTRSLRIALFGSVLVSVLIGNISGFHAAMLRQIQQDIGPEAVLVQPPTLVEIIETYFQFLPQIWKEEVPFFMGGVLGAWIGLKYLKSHESVEVQ